MTPGKHLYSCTPPPKITNFAPPGKQFLATSLKRKIVRTVPRCVLQTFTVCQCSVCFITHILTKAEHIYIRNPTQTLLYTCNCIAIVVLYSFLI